MKKYMEIVGVILFMLGIGAGDSTNLLIPILMMVAGASLYRLGVR